MCFQDYKKNLFFGKELLPVEKEESIFVTSDVWRALKIVWRFVLSLGFCCLTSSKRSLSFKVGVL